MTERYLRRLLQACAVKYTLAVTACTQLPAAPPLVPAVVGTATPTVTRVEIRLAPEERELFFHGAVRDDRGGWRQFGLRGTLNPLYGFVYDEALDRFVVPGFHAVDRTGVVTFGTDPPSRPPVSVRLTADELASRWSESRRHPSFRHEECHILAVWYGVESIALLCAPLWPVKSNPHERPRTLRFSVKYVDPRVRTNGLLGGMTLPLRYDWYEERKGWDPRSTFARFLVDGSVVAEIDRSLLARGGNFSRFDRTPPSHGALRATVRIDANGDTKVLHRGALDSAHVTAQGEVVGVRARRHRQVLLGVDADGNRIFRRVFRSFGEGARAAGHRNGACVFSTRPGGAAGSKTVACFGREAELRWQREIPMAGEWVVDDAGWVYVVWQNPSAATPTRQLSAIDPEGRTAWTIAGLSPEELLLVGEDELCFFDRVQGPNSAEHSFTDRAPDPSQWDPGDLVCLKPRHEP